MIGDSLVLSTFIVSRPDVTSGRDVFYKKENRQQDYCLGGFDNG